MVYLVKQIIGHILNSKYLLFTNTHPDGFTIFDHFCPQMEDLKFLFKEKLGEKGQ